MKCDGAGFATCDHHAWVYRDCGAGTECRPVGESITCDYPRFNADDRGDDYEEEDYYY
jgi:hypothetical protein